MKRNTSNWSNFCILLRRACLTASAGLSCLLFGRTVSYRNNNNPVTSQTSGAAAEAVADRRTAKYAPLTQAYSFMAIAAETMGAINSDGLKFLDDLGTAHRLSHGWQPRESLPVPTPVGDDPAVQRIDKMDTFTFLDPHPT